MTQDPRLRQAVTTAASSWNDKSVEQPPSSTSTVQNGLTGVARTLAAYGVESVAFDLALDLVLNEVVEQARAATGATGAAIALARNGVMECRATTGQDAPDLGMRVETETGLSGACLRTGEVQDCADTESDPRVDAEACRQLGVRSMMILPLSDGIKAFGILEVLSSQPNAFGPDDINALKKLAQRIVESKSEAEQGVAGLFPPAERKPQQTPHLERSPEKVTEIRPPVLSPVTPEPPSIPAASEPSTNDLWTTVLVILVIATAVVLGVLIGWRSGARKFVAAPTVAKPIAQPNESSAPAPAASRAPAVNSATQPLSESTRQAVSHTGPDTVSTAVPAGGLVVTENGKVIYRSQPGGQAKAPTPGTVIRRVEPQYPADAKSRRIQGPVVLDVQVLSDGNVGTIGIVSGEPPLTEAAVHAVRQWKYQPNVVNGRPVEGQTRVTINFTLPPAN